MGRLQRLRGAAVNTVFAATMSEQQIRYVKDALEVCRFPLDRLTADVTFTVVAEPPAVGHNDLMATTETDGAFTVSIRQGIDSSDSPSLAGLPNAARDTHVFFVECVMHELGHIAQKTWASTDEQIAALCALFHSQATAGVASRAGTAADWDSGSWPQRIEEAVAESWKDGWCPPEWRVYDNRTNWRIAEANWEALILALQQA
jgi:hypothetical protein